MVHDDIPSKPETETLSQQAKARRDFLSRSRTIAAAAPSFALILSLESKATSAQVVYKKAAAISPSLTDDEDIALKG
jgi:hypothetical protein